MKLAENQVKLSQRKSQDRVSQIKKSRRKVNKTTGIS
jgi:hypothetical protein